MRRHLSALAALTLAGSLAGASLAIPATAAAAPASATQAVAAPQSPLYTKVIWNKTVRRGGTITYSLKSTNKGEWPTDFAGILGSLPRGASKIRVVGAGSKTFCDVSGRELFCIFDTLKPNKSASFKIKVWLKRSTHGYAYADFGAFSIDVPEGVDVTNEEELDKLDLQSDAKFKSFRTRIVR
ncbi:DUF11 domain-containing protein [Sphaerisporangium corydalis]|uniref:DUF11 domain-containing protein n=1 Tax=Sphaerisporangium corydalis TaxID=1441875 RepID=A0ABV9EHP8_9ACTN|nr:DUF11 domain-containing protein [Sphaerisporangium corydalis]